MVSRSVGRSVTTGESGCPQNLSELMATAQILGTLDFGATFNHQKSSQSDLECPRGSQGDLLPLCHLEIMTNLQQQGRAIRHFRMSLHGSQEVDGKLDYNLSVGPFNSKQSLSWNITTSFTNPPSMGDRIKPGTSDVKLIDFGLATFSKAELRWEREKEVWNFW